MRLQPHLQRFTQIVRDDAQTDENVSLSQGLNVGKPVVGVCDQAPRLTVKKRFSCSTEHEI